MTNRIVKPLALSGLIFYGALNGLDVGTTRAAQANGAVEVGLTKRRMPTGGHLLIAGAGTVLQAKLDAKLHGKKRWIVRGATLAVYGYAIGRNVANARAARPGGR